MCGCDGSTWGLCGEWGGGEGGGREREVVERGGSEDTHLMYSSRA